MPVAGGLWKMISLPLMGARGFSTLEELECLSVGLTDLHLHS